MSIGLRFVNITVDDVDAAIAFYRDGLGYETRNDIAYGDGRWVTLGVPGEAAEIVLSQPHAGRAPADAEALGELLAKGLLPNIVFLSDDVDAAFARLQQAGAEIVQEPTDQDWGPRDCAVRDPAGNMVRVSAA
ncbi:VOC family protein [Schumannella soli]|uniref:VOC family protein n=1 Tax=Schumannella soli TaxID=2590779 RepID=A0A506Y5Q3_9MICO|nr:VOC family protein [Schumannella soli]TPW77332.1 VOC family protein [Schumannella soli]